MDNLGFLIVGVAFLIYGAYCIVTERAQLWGRRVSERTVKGTTALVTGSMYVIGGGIMTALVVVTKVAEDTLTPGQILTGCLVGLIIGISGNFAGLVMS